MKVIFLFLIMFCLYAQKKEASVNVTIKKVEDTFETLEIVQACEKKGPWCEEKKLAIIGKTELCFVLNNRYNDPDQGMVSWCIYEIAKKKMNKSWCDLIPKLPIRKMCLREISSIQP